MSTHEPVHDEEVVGPSDRSFGVVFTVVFSLVGLLPLWRGAGPRWWAVGVAVVVGLLALLWPRALAPANRVWLRIGLLLHRIVSPVALGVMFYGVVTPMGALMRVCGKDSLRLQRDDKQASYWIRRDPPGPKPDSMSNQF